MFYKHLPENKAVITLNLPNPFVWGFVPLGQSECGVFYAVVFIVTNLRDPIIKHLIMFVPYKLFISLKNPFLIILNAS